MTPHADKVHTKSMVWAVALHSSEAASLLHVSAGFLFGLTFNHEDGTHMSPQNIGLSL
jgi:hypothetical protein